MQSVKYRLAKRLEHSYWSTLGNTPLGNGLYLMADGQVADIRTGMNTDLKLIFKYYHGLKKAKLIVEDIKKLVSHLFKNKAVTGYMAVSFYKMTITANNRQYHYFNDILCDNYGIATDRLHRACQKLRKFMGRHKSSWQMNADYPHIKFYRQLHTHGMLSSLVAYSQTACNDEARAMAEYLSSKLGYTVNVRIKPIQDYEQNKPVTLTNTQHNPESQYQAIRQWLNYINKSGKLAMPTKQSDLDKWNQLTAEQKHTYVTGALNSLNGKHAHYSYTYSFKALDKKITHYSEAVRLIAYIHMERLNCTPEPSLFDISRIMPTEPIIHNNWKLGHKHLTSTEQWQRATKLSEGKAQYALIRARITVSLFLYKLNQITSELYVSSLSERKLNQTYIPTTLLSRASGVPP